MSRLEKAVQRVLNGALHGRGRALHRDGQELLATWAFVTALMLEQTIPHDARYPLRITRSCTPAASLQPACVSG